MLASSEVECHLGCRQWVRLFSLNRGSKGLALSSESKDEKENGNPGKEVEGANFIPQWSKNHYFWFRGFELCNPGY